MSNGIDKWRGRLGASLVVLGALAHLAQAAQATEKPWTFGVLNQQSPAKTAERWNPIFRYLNDVSGESFVLKMGPAVADTNAMMGRGEFDFLFSNHNFRAEFDGTYKVIARWAGAPIYAVIAVNAESPIKHINGLKGRRVAFPSTGAFVGYAVPMAAIKGAKIQIEPVMAGTQDGALAQLKASQVDAVGVNSRFLTQFAAQHGLKYREIFVSEAFPDLAISVHPRVPKAVADAVQKALIGMKADPRAAPVLESSGAPGFVAATERDYDATRKIYRKTE